MGVVLGFDSDPFVFDVVVDPRLTLRGPWKRTIRDHWTGVVLIYLILDPFVFDTAINPRSTCKGPWERTIRDHWMGVVLGFHSDPFVFGVVIDPRSTLSARLFRFKGQEAKINVYSPHIL